MDEVLDCPPCKQKIAAWVMTFADLMSLLMCFFVLLLSFSEMDALKFKRLAGSMNEAFGVQNTLNVTDIPKGTSIIAQEFSPGRVELTLDTEKSICIYCLRLSERFGILRYFPSHT